MQDFFEGRRLVIATMHRKEDVLHPLLKNGLQVLPFVVDGLNTDQLGTFSGEVARTEGPLATAKRKCILAMELSGCDLAVASEGSFGPHPSIFFLPANEECLLLLDRKNKLEIHVSHLSTETNFSGQDFRSWREVEDFAKKVGFPSHGLLLRKSKDSLEDLCKGITDLALLQERANYLLHAYGSGYIETDMRAMLNPTRMAVIQEAGEKLLRKINSRCPACGFPGFDVVSLESGLPCSLCGRPTASIKAQHLGCAHCQHKEVVPHPQGKSSEDPMYCDHCNP